MGSSVPPPAPDAEWRTERIVPYSSCAAGSPLIEFVFMSHVVKRSAAGRLRSGHDYVLIGRRAALRLPFDRLVEEFKTALRRLEPRPVQG